MVNNKILDGENNRIKIIAESILSNDESFCKFMKLCEGEFEGIDIFELYNYLTSNVKVDSEREKIKKLELIKKRYEYFDKSCYQDVGLQRLNPNLENDIVEGINFNKFPEDAALALYQSLNGKLSFHTLYSPYKRDIYELIENDIVDCEAWAFAYAYLVNKYLGPAYVKGKKGTHKSVVAVVGKSIIEADGTLLNPSAYDFSSLTDLVRAKLGLKPASFYIESIDNISIIDLPTWQNLGMFNISEDKNEKPRDEELNELLCLINESLPTFAEQNYEEESDSKIIIRKIAFINRLLGKSELKESCEIVEYLEQLFKTLLENEERTILLSQYLYRQTKNNRLEFVPILSVYLGVDNKKFEEREKREYVFLTFEEGKKQFTVIDKNEIYNSIKNRTFFFAWFQPQLIGNALERMGLDKFEIDDAGKILC